MIHRLLITGEIMSLSLLCVCMRGRTGHKNSLFYVTQLLIGKVADINHPSARPFFNYLILATIDKTAMIFSTHPFTFVCLGEGNSERLTAESKLLWPPASVYCACVEYCVPCC